MIKAVLFDLDGTLINTNELIYNSFSYVLRDVLKLNVCDEEITSTYGKPLENTMKKYENDKYTAEELIRIYRKYNEEHHDNMCKPFQGVSKMLKALKDKGIKTAIVTSKRKGLAMRGLKLGNLLQYMDVVISPEDTIKHKPEAEPAIKACEALNVKTSEAIMVADSSYDLLCGKKAGCLTCGVSYTQTGIENLLNTNPDYMVKNPLEILDILK